MGSQGEGVDEDLVLSNSTFAALQDFYKEQDDRTRRFEELQTASAESKNIRWSMDMFTEDWNASQFWYTDETAIALANELLDGATGDTQIAIVAAPSVFVQLKNILQDLGTAAKVPHVSLLEYDSRFKVFDEFVQYDYEQPLRLDPGLKGRFERIVCDPPFLSLDCQTKAAMTVRWLKRKHDGKGDSTQESRLIVCTGERMEGEIHKLYPGTKTTSFEPKHAQDRLSNEFRCYANYASALWSFN